MKSQPQTVAASPHALSLLVRPSADETGIANSGSVKISWRRYGDGAESMLIVPTWNFVDSRVVRYQVEGLRERFRVIAYDARGSGESGHPATGYGFDDHVADALAVLEATSTESASLVAASLGTHVAALLASRYSPRVRRLALVAPPMDIPGSGSPSGSETEEVEDGESDEPNWRTEYARFVPWFISTVFPEPHMDATIREIIEIGLQADHRMLVQQSSELDWDEAPRHLGNIRCPTLVIHGTADRTLRLKSVQEVAAAIPGAQLAVVDGLGHRPDISRPDIVNELLLDFFR